MKCAPPKDWNAPLLGKGRSSGHRASASFMSCFVLFLLLILHIQHHVATSSPVGAEISPNHEAAVGPKTEPQTPTPQSPNLPKEQFKGYCRYGSNSKKWIKDVKDVNIQQCRDLCKALKGWKLFSGRYRKCKAFAFDSGAPNANAETKGICSMYEGGPYTYGDGKANTICYNFPSERFQAKGPKCSAADANVKTKIEQACTTRNWLWNGDGQCAEGDRCQESDWQTCCSNPARCSSCACPPDRPVHNPSGYCAALTCAQTDQDVCCHKLGQLWRAKTGLSTMSRLNEMSASGPPITIGEVVKIGETMQYDETSLKDYRIIEWPEKYKGLFVEFYDTTNGVQKNFRQCYPGESVDCDTTFADLDARSQLKAGDTLPVRCPSNCETSRGSTPSSPSPRSQDITYAEMLENSHIYRAKVQQTVECEGGSSITLNIGDQFRVRAPGVAVPMDRKTELTSKANWLKASKRKEMEVRYYKKNLMSYRTAQQATADNAFEKVPLQMIGKCKVTLLKDDNNVQTLMAQLIVHQDYVKGCGFLNQKFRKSTTWFKPESKVCLSSYVLSASTRMFEVSKSPKSDVTVWPACDEGGIYQMPHAPHPGTSAEFGYRVVLPGTDLIQQQGSGWMGNLKAIAVAYKASTNKLSIIGQVVVKFAIAIVIGIMFTALIGVVVAAAATTAVAILGIVGMVVLQTGFSMVTSAAIDVSFDEWRNRNKPKDPTEARKGIFRKILENAKVNAPTSGWALANFVVWQAIGHFLATSGCFVGFLSIDASAEGMPWATGEPTFNKPYADPMKITSMYGTAFDVTPILMAEIYMFMFDMANTLASKKEDMLTMYFDLAGVPDDMRALSESGEIAVGSDCKPENGCMVGLHQFDEWGRLKLNDRTAYAFFNRIKEKSRGKLDFEVVEWQKKLQDVLKEAKIDTTPYSKEDLNKKVLYRCFKKKNGDDCKLDDALKRSLNAMDFVPSNAAADKKP